MPQQWNCSCRSIATRLSMAAMLLTKIRTGGEGAQSQHRVLNEGVDVLVCTPGRLIDLLGKEWVSLNK